MERKISKSDIILYISTVGVIISWILIFYDFYIFDFGESDWFLNCTTSYVGKIDGYDVYNFTGCKPKSLTGFVPSFTMYFIDEEGKVVPTIYIYKNLTSSEWKNCLKVELCNARYSSSNSTVYTVLTDFYCNLRGLI